MFDDMPRRWPVNRIPDTIAELEAELDNTRRPWNGFDTFLRRALMIGATLLVWLSIMLGAVYCVDRMTTPPPPSDVYPSHAPSLLACEPEDVDC